ncbi:fungal fruit body lectin-domain-containing protein [Panaeolus papilionaceus]|nr:fungal fruit body lectin-domain-containing protein [Panaeolus papilionaceus]
MVVYNPTGPHKQLYDIDNESTGITLADSYHALAPVAGSIPSPDATLIHGIGRYLRRPSVPLAVVNVQRNKRYRFRLANIACSPNNHFSIDGHALTIIEVETVNVHPTLCQLTTTGFGLTPTTGTSDTKELSTQQFCKSNGQQVLNMGGSGTSGTIRFVADNGENFIVALGVHNYKRWCDIVTNLGRDQTGTVINPQYYNDGPRAYQREKQLASYSVKNAKGRQFAVKFTDGEGQDLACDIIVG